MRNHAEWMRVHHVEEYLAHLLDALVDCDTVMAHARNLAAIRPGLLEATENLEQALWTIQDMLSDEHEVALDAASYNTDEYDAMLREQHERTD